MKSSELRQAFLDFFAQREHTVVPSSSLVPDDPTLLFTNAGMVQFKPFFLGEKPAPYLRATSAQKVMRAGGKDSDLEEVGKTSRHFAFFEMLGNFSFGDYFKQDACIWAWELVTSRLGLDPSRLWVTIYKTDDESAQIWESEVGISPDRIIRRGKDNFWSMGVAGPCGPCSEILYDRGESFGKQYVAGGEIDDERYLEFYNLVFMQNIQDDSGEVVGDLPKKNIDTGMGLARTASILQDVPTIFDIDTMVSLRRAAEEVTGRRYHSDSQTDVSLRVLAEHARAIAFVITDGVLPSNEHRGYVLRRLIRRAIRYARKLDYDEPFLSRLTDVAVDLDRDAYPELERHRDLITAVVEKEEARFDLTLRQGLGMLEDEIARVKAEAGSVLSGEVAFKLHDTYGFPLDLTTDIAGEESLQVDSLGFEGFMDEQRKRARAARKTGIEREAESAILNHVLAESGKTEFLAYETLQAEGTILALVRGGEGVNALAEGEEGELILDASVFYAESGGQVGDRGVIQSDGSTFSVSDTQYGVPGLIVHVGRVAHGEIEVGQAVQQVVDQSHREGVRQSHTATHMLHWALHQMLGEHARQQGSLVEPGRLRFDFSHYEAVPPERLIEIEEEINRRVLFDDSVRAYETTFDNARSLGAMALFGEKYGDIVRVVEVGDYSKELCGGTHVFHTGQVGLVKITGEGSVAAGTRRVEAFTGLAGLRHLNERAARLESVAGALKVEPEHVLERVEKLQGQIKELEGALAKVRAATQKSEVEEILRSEEVVSFGPVKLVAVRLDRTVDELRNVASTLRGHLGSAVVVIASLNEGKANLVASVSRDLVDAGVSAKDIVSGGAGELGGGGGGTSELAIAGGPHGEHLSRALQKARETAEAALQGLQ